MKEDLFEIYVDRLRRGEVEEIEAVKPASFLGVDELELCYLGDFIVKGEAYLANETLILNLTIQCEAQMPCSICNEPTQFVVDVPNFYHTVPLNAFKGAIFDYGNLVRDTLVLETPKFVECHGGKCPHRIDVVKYLKEEEGFHPFADLTNEEN